MSDRDWDKIKFFSKNEFDVNSQEMISFDLLYALDKLRGILGSAIYPSPASGAIVRPYEGGSKSWHCIIPGRNKYGMAIDLFPTISIIDTALVAVSIPEIQGIGIYPFWRWGAKELIGGVHIDIRPPKASGEKVVWWRDAEGVYRYLHPGNIYVESKNILEAVK